jgi:hypothetical protein
MKGDAHMKKLMWLLPLVALIVSCGGEEDEYLPLAVGNVWNYDMTYLMITNDTLQTAGTSVTEVTGETTLDNDVDVLEYVETMTWDDTLLVPNSVDTSYLLENDDYLLIYDDLADTLPDTSLVLPIEQGNAWVVYADSVDTLTAEVVGQETVTVPAGTYDDCWDIEYTSLGQTQHNWFALDVGIVKHFMQVVDQNMTVEFTRELTSYDLQ